MSVREYYAFLLSIIQDCPFVIHWNMEFDEIDPRVGYFKGMLEFMNGSTFHFVEFVETYENVKRLKYKYHFQSESGDLIMRWDNVPHPSKPMDLKSVIDKIIGAIIEELENNNGNLCKNSFKCVKK